MQHRAAEDKRIQRLNKAEARPEALPNPESTNTFQSLDDGISHLDSKHDWPPQFSFYDQPTSGQASQTTGISLQSDTWLCPECDLHNTLDSLACDNCGLKQPPQPVPEDWPSDNDALLEAFSGEGSKRGVAEMNQQGNVARVSSTASDIAESIGKESFVQKLTGNGSVDKLLSIGVEKRSGTEGVDDDREELKDWQGHSILLHDNFLNPYTNSKRPPYSGLSTSAQVNLKGFILQFVGKMYETSDDQAWDHHSRKSRSATSMKGQFEDYLRIYAARLMKASTAAFNASADANDKNTTLTLFGAVLIKHCRVTIQGLFSVWESGSHSFAVEFLEASLRQMYPLDFSPGRHGLKAKPMITLGSYRSMAGKVAPSHDDVVELSQYLEKTISDAELSLIVDVLVSTDEMRFLALCLRSCLCQENCSAIQLINATISAKDLFYTKRGNLRAKIQVYWSIAKFMRDQYGDQYGVDIPQFGTVVALTGSSTRRAQASTCSDYIISTWPTTGPFFLKLLDAIHAAFFAADTQRQVRVCSEAHPGFSVQAYVNRGNNRSTLTEFEVHAMEYDLLLQTAQLLSWLSSAFTISPFMDQLAYSTPLFTRNRQGVFSISTKHQPVHDIEQICWLNLFNRACIVVGFPISDRSKEIGLEISLELLAGLSGARHIFEYEGGLVMKGFSHMFVPVRRQLDRVQWHAVSSHDEETPLSYHDGVSLCASRAMIDEVGLQDLASLRAIVGWCSKATTCLGSSQVDYEKIDYTKADEANSGLRLTGGSLGFQQFGVAALDVRFGSKDGKSHFQRRGPYQRIIQFAEGSPILLHDVEGKQSWLVPATNVMLHIVQHRHRLDPFQANGQPIRLDTDIATESSAKVILLEHRAQVLFEEDKHTFMDEILDVWSVLEFLLAQNLTRQREAPGVHISSSLHESLYGFEFKAIVHQDAPYKLKKTNISRNHGGWSKLIEDIDALVLFANGFGDVILPAGESNRDLCHKWRRVPHGQNYLATTTDMLQRLFDKAGCRLDRQYLTTKSKLRWHQGRSALFNACRNVDVCDCNRLQQLVPESAIRSVRSPASIASEGAVIFGQPKNCVTRPSFIETQISGNLYSQPNVPFSSNITHRRASTIDEATENISRLHMGPMR
ncbi:hypothetical protein AA0118_g9253 [Alternaria tenuissima]|nr:hypothetical protein AA0118_g9253 [Alternaria tenuissima]